MSSKLKVWIGTPFVDTPLFLDKYSPDPLVDIVAEREEADYLMVPHNWTHVRYDADPTFLKNYEHPTKKTIIFWIGDSAEKVRFPNAIIFRTSGYKSELASNEIIMPTDVEDLGLKYGITTHIKTDTPSVGFVGWASQIGLAKAKSDLKNFFLSGPHKKGLYFRQRAMQALSTSSLVRSDFIVRGSYHRGSQEDHVNNIKATDFTLAPKGDGNYSGRFYEVLSLGRLPILIDTDCALPLEDQIKYDEFMVRVPYADIAHSADYINKFYQSKNEQEWQETQVKARKAFENYLQIGVYLKRVLTKEFLARYA